MTWLRRLFGCCCVLTLVVGIAGYLAYKKAQQSFSLDPARIAARAAEAVPGARPPQGYEGKFLMDMNSLVMASFLPKGSSTGTSLTVMVFPLNGKTPEQARNEAVESYHKNNSKSKARELSSREVELQLGGHPIKTLEHRLEAGGAVSLQYTIVATIPGDARNIVLVIASGSEKTFDRKAMDEFLENLQLVPVPQT